MSDNFYTELIAEIKAGRLWHTCSHCKGTGESTMYVCNTCQGKGVRKITMPPEESDGK